MKSLAALTLASATIVGCAHTSHTARVPARVDDLTVVPVAEVPWGHLNPARGDKSPRAGALWGDRTKPGPAGFLVRFDEGFSSPPHIHNVSYRGVVIEGLAHNDDPGAASMWMPAGSYWTQPKGEAHITAARAPINIAYIEIDDGPYLVLPVDEAFDSGERPINIDPSNLVWLDAQADSAGAKIAHLWGDPDGGARSGALVQLPAGFRGTIHADAGPFHVVVVQGMPTLEHRGGVTLEPGSYFGGDADTARAIPLRAGAPSIIYIRSNGGVNILSTPGE